jgi:small conductance mechanosensitive channel
MSWSDFTDKLVTLGIAGFLLKVLGAIAVWVIGRRLIHFAIMFSMRALRRQSVEETLLVYIGSTISVLLNVALVIAILGYFGVETTTFAALVAGAGVAIGAAWGGLLANFAAGAFLVVLRPFKVGDVVSAAGVTGTVEEIGLFATTIDRADNVRTFVGNNKIFGDTIQNFSTNPYRRVDLTAQLHSTVDHRAAIALLKERLAQIPNVIAKPPPDVEILELNALGPRLAVRPYRANKDYWQVYYDTNRLIREVFGEAGYPAPEQRVRVVQGGG